MRGISRVMLVLVSLLLLSDWWQKFGSCLEDNLEKESKAYTPRWAKKWTKKQSGCPCWFDLSRGLECACCYPKGVQCGFPKQRFCQRDKSVHPTKRKGCPGIKNRQHTLSEIGHPCLDDITDKSCAWCGLYSQQCNSWEHNENKCGYLSAYAPGANNIASDYCLGRVQDCRLPPSYCGVNAACVNTYRKIPNNYGGYAYRCACKSGFIGNGITCANATSGEIEVDQDMRINMHLELGPTITIERTEENFPIGKAAGDLENELKHLQASGDGNEVFCTGSATTF